MHHLLGLPPKQIMESGTTVAVSGAFGDVSDSTEACPAEGDGKSTAASLLFGWEGVMFVEDLRPRFLVVIGIVENG